MLKLTPFMYSPYHAPDKPYLVYSVNCDKPEVTSGYVQGYWKCTHCDKGNQYRFYDDGDPHYDAKCPDCNKYFIAIDDTCDIKE